jgi:hypothetical protein
MRTGTVVAAAIALATGVAAAQNPSRGYGRAGQGRHERELAETRRRHGPERTIGSGEARHSRHGNEHEAISLRLAAHAERRMPS